MRRPLVTSGPDEWLGYGTAEALVWAEEGRCLLLQGAPSKSLPGGKDLRGLFGSLNALKKWKVGGAVRSLQVQ